MKFFSDEQKGAFYVILSGLFYGLIGYFGISIIRENFSAYNMLFWRFLVASGVMLIFGFWQMRGRFFHKNFSEIKKIFFYSAIFHGSSSILYFLASAKIGTGLSMVLFFIYPLVVVMLNVIFYNTKVSASYFVAITAILFGIILLANPQSFSSNFLGVMLGSLAAICFGFYVFSVQKTTLPPLALAFIVSFGCCVISGISALIDGSLYIPQQPALYVDILSMGIICTALPILLFLQGLKYIDSNKASLLGVSEPLAVLFFGWLLLAEEIAFIQLIGSAVILIGAAIALMEKGKKQAKNLIKEVM